MATGFDSRIAAIQEDFLSCKICFEDLDQPKTLPCLHTFCLKCLEQHSRRNRQPGNRFACPICRRDCQVPGKGIQDFPTNFMLQGLKDVIQSPIGEAKESTLMCEKHSEIVSMWFCSKCYECICQNCMETNHKKQSCLVFNLKESQFIGTLHEQQQKNISGLQKDMEKWKIDSNEMTSKVKQFQRLKQNLKNRANRLYSDLERKLFNEKNSVQENIDQMFALDTDAEVILEKIKGFEEEIKETNTFLTAQQNPSMTVSAIHTWKHFDKTLQMHSKSLKDKYSNVSGEMFTQLPKANLRVRKEYFDTIMSNPLVEVETNPNVREITCSVLNEFSARFSSESEVDLDELVCTGKIIYIIDRHNNSVKMINQQGDGLAEFKDRHAHNRYSLCLLSKHTVAVSHGNGDVKLFDLEGKFTKIVRTHISSPGMAPLSDGTIAIGHDGNCIDVYDQNLKLRLDIQSIHCDTCPNYMCANKENDLFFSVEDTVYYCDRSKNKIYNLSETKMKFNPYGLCIDRWGNLLVANCKYSKIHIFFKDLDGTWDDKVLLDQRNDKLHHPKTLAFNEEGDLVVAQNNGKIKIFSYSVK